MLMSRANALLNVGLKFAKQGSAQRNVQLQTVRHNWHYRTYQAKSENFTVIATDVLSTITWWWILWHTYHEYINIIGEHPFPDVSAWTDEELGIPPDDAD